MNHLPRPDLPEGWVVLAEDMDGEMLVWCPHNLLIVNALGDTTGNVFIGDKGPRIAIELDRVCLAYKVGHRAGELPPARDLVDPECMKEVR